MSEPGTVELTGVNDRNTFERVLRAVREIAAIVALTLVSVLMILLLVTLGSLGDKLGAVTTPDPSPAVTGCPFGEGMCGG